MRTSCISLAVLLLSATSIAYAQEGKEPGAGGPGPGGGPAIERGGGPSIGGGGDGLSMGARGPSGDDGRSEGRSRGPDADGGRRGTDVERQAAPKSESPPSERKASRKSEGRSAKSEDDSRPRREGKARDETEKSVKRATKQDSGKEADKSERADRKADHTDQKPDATRRSEKSEDASSAKRADSKPRSTEAAKSVSLNEDKKGRLREAFHGVKDVKPRRDVNIDISIGRRLPRDWDFLPVPIAVIDIVPEYRDYVFVYVDDEYVICDPVTYEVVTVIPADGGRYAGGSSGSGRCPAHLSLSRDERELILDSVRSEHEIDVGNLEIGWSVPADIELQRFPAPVLSEADELGACRFFVARDQLAIVDPEEEKVVLVIDKG